MHDFGPDPFGASSGFDFFGIMFTLFPIFFMIILGIILFTVFKNIKEWSNNNKQPRLSVGAIVVSKRIDVSRTMHNHNNNHAHSTSTTRNYVTFEVESGDRMEFQVSGKEYGLLAERDKGKLAFQGTRYLSFERIS
ncbi:MULTISPECIES: DUF2500 domain-containing protein [Bacillus]|uniref:DUF2500 domain-containing protein n=1 Tax=Bacillus TaxID=1386 RepID=UPI0018E238D9|nr:MULTISPECIES: DUF2500 domain-containing protein [Bacillus]